MLMTTIGTKERVELGLTVTEHAARSRDGCLVFWAVVSTVNFKRGDLENYRKLFPRGIPSLSEVRAE